MPNWRNTGRPVRFLGLDGRAAFFLVLITYHPSWFTFGVSLVGVALLIYLERKGYTFWNAGRRLRVWFLGNRRPAVVNARKGRSDR